MTRLACTLGQLVCLSDETAVVQTTETHTRNAHLTISVALVYPRLPQRQLRVQTVLDSLADH